MIAGSLFLLVGGVVLFIHDNQRQITDGSEHRRARAHNNAGIAGADSPPLLSALIGRERRMQDGNFVSEKIMQVGGCCGGQADLRDKQNCGAALSQDRLHGGKIDSRLPRTGDSVQQSDFEFSRGCALKNFSLGLALFLA